MFRNIGVSKLNNKNCSTAKNLEKSKVKIESIPDYLSQCSVNPEKPTKWFQGLPSYHQITSNNTKKLRDNNLKLGLKKKTLKRTEIVKKRVSTKTMKHFFLNTKTQLKLLPSH